MPMEVKGKDKVAKGMKKAFSDSLADKIKKNVPSLYKLFHEDEDEPPAGGKAKKGAKSFLTKSLRERRGK